MSHLAVVMGNVKNEWHHEILSLACLHSRGLMNSQKTFSDILLYETTLVHHAGHDIDVI